MSADFEKKFGIPLIQTYGQTESGHIAGWTASDLPLRERKQGSVGRPYPGVDVRIVDAEGHAVDAGTVGEIVCRSEGVMQGYSTTDEVRNEYLSTGDLGYIDVDGFLYVVGRLRDVIIAGGFNVYPAEVEAVIRQYAGVRDVAVFALADERLGEIPVALVVPAEPVPDPDRFAAELAAYCREQLSAYKVPRRFALVQDLPRTETMKTRVADLVKTFHAATGGVSS